MRIIKLKNGELLLKERILGFLERRVTSFGNSAKVDCPKAYIGKRAYLILCEDEQGKNKSKSSIRGISKKNQ